MAHLKNLDAFTFNQAQWQALRSSQVGNNRMVTLTPEGELQCRLHGHKVASFKGGEEGLDWRTRREGSPQRVDITSPDNRRISFVVPWEALRK